MQPVVSTGKDLKDRCFLQQVLAQAIGRGLETQEGQCWCLFLV